MMLSKQAASSKAPTQRYPVLVAGGGPTGLMLAGELALVGIDVAIIERRPNQDLAGMRAGGLHMRTLEVLDQRGLGDRFVAQGEPHQVVPYHGAMLDVKDVPSRRNYFIALAQNHTERLLADWVEALGVPIYRDREVIGFEQDDHGVDVQTSQSECFRADYLVGCDGARSLVRKTAGIAFDGWDPTKSWLIAEAEWEQEPEWGMKQQDGGTYVLGRMENPRQVRIVLAEKTLQDGSEPELREVSAALIPVYGTDFGIHSPTWVSRFTDRCRQAAEYRRGRVLLAGDAAHIHPPMGGQGLNLGIQDAVNLGWKLASVIKGHSPDSLLDSYHAERHPVAARVLLATMADVALQRQDEHTKALGVFMSELAAMDGPRQHIVGERSGLSIRYDLGDGHPLLGRRMPDIGLTFGEDQRTAYAFLHKGLPVLFDLTGGKRSGWNAQGLVDVVRVEGPDVWQLPVIGNVPAPNAVLVRPDGYVAWVGDDIAEGLKAARSQWFGLRSPDEGTDLR